MILEDGDILRHLSLPESFTMPVLRLEANEDKLVRIATYMAGTLKFKNGGQTKDVQLEPWPQAG